MYHFKVFSILFFIISLIPVYSHANQRQIPKGIDTRTIKITFNNENLKGIYSVTDTRTDVEKTRDLNNGTTAGAIILFLNGHAQRPVDTKNFINDLAVNSKSGIVVTPICDTPYGKNPLLRGDNGKDIILMEMTRYILSSFNIAMTNYVVINGLPVLVNNNAISLKPQVITSDVAVVGWSHGGLLSRRLASTWPETITGLGQVCPAGYNDWLLGPGTLALAFSGEGLNISTLLFTRSAPHAIRAGYGFASGVFADSIRGIGSSVLTLSPGKMFRSLRDVSDCSLYATGSNFPVNNINNGVVIFGLSDTVMDTDHSGIKGSDQPDDSENEKFWADFYPDLKITNGNFRVNFLKGNHIAPVVHHKLYSSVILEGLQEMLPEALLLSDN